MYVRNTGKLCFATLQDGEGRRLQAMLSRAEVGEEALEAFKTDVDLGDHLFVRGRVIASRRGELSVFADSYRIRSEEHTSELQSRGHLVCRLLLAKKKDAKVV